ncbi:MAG: GNAT family N-acetyltransferase, partial [Pseudomonadota bacterium]
EALPAGWPLEETLYCAESVLLARYRGRGIGHAFFDAREAHGRALGLKHAVFAAVTRRSDHPLKPRAYRPLDPFWRSRGYAPIDGAVARFAWRDVNESEETQKPLQLWARRI